MNPVPDPKVPVRPSVPLIWIVPLVAALVAAWLLSREWRHYGEVIEIDFETVAGVQPGRTRLLYKGVSVGIVDHIELKPDFSGVRTRVQLHRSAGALARGGAQFWIVHPEIGFSGISGMEALVGGVHLQMRSGTGPPTRTFLGLERPPAPEATGQGPAFLLRSDRVGNVHPGAPVFFRDIRVGVVETNQLSPDATSALIRIRLLAPYRELVRTDSEFWNAGGLPVQISLFGGGRPQSSSLQSLVTGAIGFATPDEPGPIAEDGTHFELRAEMDKAWLKWRPAIPIHSEEASPADNPRPTDMQDLLGVPPPP